MAIAHHSARATLSADRRLSLRLRLEAVCADHWRVFQRENERYLGDLHCDDGRWKCSIDHDEALREEALVLIGPTSSVSSDRTAVDQYQATITDCCSTLGIDAQTYSRQRRLPLMLEPSELSCIGTDIFDRQQYLTPAAAAAWQAMVAAAASAGVVLQPVSCFRDHRYQAGIVRRKLDNGLDLTHIMQVSAAPGFSEHHTGRAVDITSPNAEPLEESFAGTAAYAWLQENARMFGFVLSYPKNNCHGLAWEPWHWCFQASGPEA